MKPIRYAIENNTARIRDAGDYVRFDEYEKQSSDLDDTQFMLVRALDEIDTLLARIKELEGK